MTIYMCEKKKKTRRLIKLKNSAVVISHWVRRILEPMVRGGGKTGTGLLALKKKNYVTQKTKKKK